MSRRAPAQPSSRARALPRALITFVLAEAELELVPPELAKNAHVAARAKKRKRQPEHLLLDQAVDHEAMRSLAVDADRRGRPDIAHFWSLLVMDSLVAKRGLARALIHTRNDELIRIRADARLPRSQPKFYQLMEDLLRQGEVPLGKPLLKLERRRDLASVIEETSGARVLMDVGGERGRAARFAELARAGDLTLVTGGFPRGSFRQADRARFDHTVRVADEELTVWSAMVPVLAGVEDALLG